MSISLLACALGWDWDERQILPRIKNPLSKQFRSRTADITYRSSDGVLFKIHSLYLKTHTENLDPPDGVSLAEVADLPEDSQTLDLLFRFVYPIPQPNLDLLKFNVLCKLAEAAEKYGVYPAMSRCKFTMEKFLRKHPFAIFLYAARHDHRDLLDQAALLHLMKPIEVGVRGMPEEYAVLWVRYYAAWDLVRRDALKKLCNHYSIEGCPISERALLTRLHSDLTWIQHFRYGTSSWPTDIVTLSSAFERATRQRHDPAGGIQQAVRRMRPFSGFQNTADAQGGQRTGTSKAQQKGSVPNDRQSVSRYPSPFSDKGEITFCSSDGKRFAVHRAVIKASGDGFPLSSASEEIALLEDSFTLDLIMQFMHKMAQPDLRGLEYEQLERLAMAAHKYKVHYATGICKEHLRKFWISHSLSMLIFALRVEDYEFMDLVTPLVLDMCFKDVVTQLPNDLVILWTGYYAWWTKAAEKAFNIFLRYAESSKMYAACPWCSSGTQRRALYRSLGDGIAGFRKLGAEIVHMQSQSRTCVECAAWVSSFARACDRRPEPFSYYVKRLKHGLRLW